MDVFILTWLCTYISLWVNQGSIEEWIFKLCLISTSYFASSGFQSSSSKSSNKLRLAQWVLSRAVEVEGFGEWSVIRRDLVADLYFPGMRTSSGFYRSFATKSLILADASGLLLTATTDSRLFWAFSLVLRRASFCFLTCFRLRSISLNFLRPALP